MYVRCILIICSNSNGRSDCWFGNLADLHSPIILGFFEIRQTILGLTIRDNKVHSFRTEDSIDFRNHLIRISCGPFSTKHRVEGPLIDHSIKGIFWKVHGSNIHLNKLKVRSLILVFFVHSFDDCRGDVSVRDVLVTLVEHLFAQPGVSGSHVQNSMFMIDIVLDELLNAVESLIPVEGLRVSASVIAVPGVSLFPVLDLPVLAHEI